MRYRIAALTVGFAVIVAACTSANGKPATAPPVPDTLPTTTTSVPATTTVAPSTTTTLDRLTEIQAIFEDLERRRLQAIYDQDEEAFRSVYANDEYAKRSIKILSTVKVLRVPDQVMQEVVETLADTEGCIAAVVRFDNTGTFEGGGTGESIHVVELRPDGQWGLSWVGTGWACDGPHPFS